MSLREDRGLAVVSGKLVIQCDPDRSEAIAVALQKAIDDSSMLRRRGDIAPRQGRLLPSCPLPLWKFPDKVEIVFLKSKAQHNPLKSQYPGVIERSLTIVEVLAQILDRDGILSVSDKVPDRGETIPTYLAGESLGRFEQLLDRKFQILM